MFIVVSYYLFFCFFCFFFNDTATTEIYTTRHTLSLHDALPISHAAREDRRPPCRRRPVTGARSEEHTSELQSRLVISYAVFCLKKKKTQQQKLIYYTHLKKKKTTYNNK